MSRARAEGQGRSVAARGDKRGKMGRRLALCSALNSLGAAREPWGLHMSGGPKAARRSLTQHRDTATVENIFGVLFTSKLKSIFDTNSVIFAFVIY